MQVKHVVSLSAFTCFGKLPLIAFEKPLLAKDCHGRRVPLSFSVLGPSHAKEGVRKPVSVLAGVVLTTCLVLAP